MENEKFFNFTGEDTPLTKLPGQYLQDYADIVNDNMKKQIFALVIESTSSSKEEITYSLYLTIPQLKDLHYKLFHVVQKNLSGYPSDMILFAKDPVNNQHRENLSEGQFVKELNDLFYSPITKGILGHLLKLIEIKEHYNKEIE